MDNGTRSDATKGRLVDAAIDLIADKGVQGASFAEICRRCELSRGAIHHHYASLPALLVDVVRTIGDRIRAGAFAGIDSLGPDQDVYEFGIDYVWQQMQTAEFMALSQIRSTVSVDESLKGEVRRELREVHQWWMEQANNVSGLGSDNADPQTTMIILTALMGTHLIDAAMGPPVEDRDRHAYRAKLKDLVLR